MLPLSLLKCAAGYPILIELKNGETYNGKLRNMDLWMNVNLTEVIRTSSDGKQFWKVEEMYVRGNTIKYVRIPDSVLDVAEEEKQAREAARNRRGGRSGSRGRGGRGGRGRNSRYGDRDRDRERDRQGRQGGQQQGR